MRGHWWMLGVVATAASLTAGSGVAGQDELAFRGERHEAFVTLTAPGGDPVLRYVREPIEDEPAPDVEGACFTHPLRTPAGEVVTDVSPADHKHHRGVFFAWVRAEG